MSMIGSSGNIVSSLLEGSNCPRRKNCRRTRIRLAAGTRESSAAWGVGQLPGLCKPHDHERVVVEVAAVVWVYGLLDAAHLSAREPPQHRDEDAVPFRVVVRPARAALWVQSLPPRPKRPPGYISRPTTNSAGIFQSGGMGAAASAPSKLGYSPKRHLLRTRLAVSAATLPLIEESGCEQPRLVRASVHTCELCHRSAPASVV